MSATAVHSGVSATEQSYPQPPADLPQAPQWINDLMDAANAGETEFRKEVRAQIKAGHGPELISTVEEMVKRTDGDAQKATQQLLELVTKWVQDPEELEEGGRYWGGLGCGGLFGSAFGCGYYPYHRHYPIWNPCLPPIYTCGPWLGGCDFW
jgi:hypothetical protein